MPPKAAIRTRLGFDAVGMIGEADFLQLRGPAGAGRTFETFHQLEEE
jgi:hypothetical protein